MNELGLIVQVLVHGIFFGAMYGITAVGLSLIFGTMRIIFVTQGAVMVFFAYFCFWAFSLLGIDPFLSLIPIILIASLFGLGFYYGLFKEVSILKDRFSSLIIAVGLMFFLENFMTVAWTANPRAVLTSYAFYKVSLFGISLPFARLVWLLIALLATGGVLVFLKKTLIGTVVRAISEDAEASSLMGINPNRVNAVAFAIGIGLAAIAGSTLATTYGFGPVSGFDFAIKALIALTLGGIGKVGGALLGGILLGLIESLGTGFVGGGWSQGIVFAVFLLVLTFRPYGLFGGAGQKS
jgi:branched-chain amino acid transport system permease protein